MATPVLNICTRGRFYSLDVTNRLSSGRNQGSVDFDIVNKILNIVPGNLQKRPGNIMEFCYCRKVGTMSVPTERMCL